jgi:probable DNA repair protein
MGTSAEAEIDAWLRSGGLIVTASDRAARALVSAFHRTRRTEGLTAWPAPNILDWKSFVRAEWSERAKSGKCDSRLLLNPIQERALWAEIAGGHNHPAALLEGPRYRLASLAMDAHELLCSNAPNLLRSAARAGWQQDPAAFSEWLTAFDESCSANDLLSPARLPLELIALLENAGPPRPPLLLAGFDRILHTQSNILNAWGSWRQVTSSEPAAQILFRQAPDTQAELAACALWCGRQLAANPNARLLVVTQDAADRTRRGQIERAFLRAFCDEARSASSPLFEFTLGIPLSQVALPKAASLLLRWLSAPLAEHELDWLFSTGYVAANAQESAALQAHMRAFRSRGTQQPHWTLRAFIAASSSLPAEEHLPSSWINRISDAQRRVDESAHRPQSPLDWVELVPQLLAAAGFPGANPLSSVEFQAADRWQQVLETCASLGFDAQRMQWKDFLSALSRTVDETLFAPESRDAPIQITGPAESAGLTADAVWFLSATEDAWPPSGATHPLLPPEVQRQAGMPHGSPQLDWELARAITTRLIQSTSNVHFSCARQLAGTESRPSRLISELAGIAQPLPPELTLQPSPPPITFLFEDFSRIPFAPGKVHGGASVLTSQSQCPFKAFATARLAAQTWEPAEAGLTASQRGVLLHAALRGIWSDPPQGLKSHQHLLLLNGREEFVAAHVRRALQKELGSEIRNRMPRRYLELEGKRLTNLLVEWLNYEATRIEFDVVTTEADRSINIVGLEFNLRPDRIDRLNDGSLLVVDYKSGDVSPKSWDLPRPDDVQLPLYAGFALEEELGGLVFAKVRAGDQSFAGRVGDAKSTLHAKLSGTSSLIKSSLTAELLIDWRAHIEQLAKDFLAGRAEVDPRDYPKTCERCGLQTLCRIEDNRSLIKADENGEDEEAADE